MWRSPDWTLFRYTLLTCPQFGCILDRKQMGTDIGEQQKAPSSKLPSDPLKPATKANGLGEDRQQPSNKFAKYLIILSVLFIVGIAALAVVFREEVKNFHEYSYLGAFLISVMSGGTIIVPIPGVPIIFTLGGIVPYPFLVGIAAGLGEGLGAFNFYLAGRGGQTYVPERHKSNRFYAWVERWMTKHGYLTLFLGSAIFNPAFSLIGLMAGASRMPAWKFYLVCAAGKAVKGTYVAYLGTLGMDYVLDWFGIDLET